MPNALSVAITALAAAGFFVALVAMYRSPRVLAWLVRRGEQRRGNR
jgi:hypothetical protein